MSGGTTFGITATKSQLLEQHACAGIEQAVRECRADCLDVSDCAAVHAAIHLLSVGRADDAAQLDLPALDPRMPRDRRLTTSLQSERERSLGFAALPRKRVVERAHQLDAASVVLTAFDTDDALTHRRHELLQIEPVSDAIFEAEADQPGRGEHDCVVLIFLQLAQPGLDVAPQREQLQVRIVHTFSWH